MHISKHRKDKQNETKTNKKCTAFFFTDDDISRKPLQYDLTRISRASRTPRDRRTLSIRTPLRDSNNTSRGTSFTQHDPLSEREEPLGRERTLTPLPQITTTASRLGRNVRIPVLFKQLINFRYRLELYRNFLLCKSLVSQDGYELFLFCSFFF